MNRPPEPSVGGAEPTHTPPIAAAVPTSVGMPRRCETSSDTVSLLPRLDRDERSPEPGLSPDRHDIGAVDGAAERRSTARDEPTRDPAPPPRPASGTVADDEATWEACIKGSGTSRVLAGVVAPADTGRRFASLEVSAIRAARLAVALPLGDAASAAGVGTVCLHDALGRLEARGRCAAAAAGAVLSDHRQHHKTAALSSPACPPAAVRAAAQTRPLHDPQRLAGPAGWQLRRCGSLTVPRRVCALRHGVSPAGRFEAALSGQCPPAVLAGYAQDGDPSIRCAAFSNDACWPSALAGCVDDDSDARVAAANNTASPAALLKRLAGDTDRSVRMMAAWNRSTPADALRGLCADPARQVRGCLPHNRGCPADVLEQLAGDAEQATRFAVASHRNCPPEALRLLATDPHDAVAARAAEHPGCELSLVGVAAARQFAPTCHETASNPACPADALDALAADDDPHVRQFAQRALDRLGRP